MNVFDDARHLQDLLKNGLSYAHNRACRSLLIYMQGYFRIVLTGRASE